MSNNDEQEDAQLLVEREEVIEQRIVDFMGDPLILARTKSGIYATLPGMCKSMGLNTQGQQRRILNTNRLRGRLRSLVLETRGGLQAINCLDTKAVPMWLIGIESSKAKPAFQAKIDEYYDRLEPLAEQTFAQIMGVQLSVQAPTLPIDPRILALAQNTDQILDVTQFIWQNRGALLLILQSLPALQLRFDDVQRVMEALVERQDATNAQVRRIDERTQGLTPAQARTMQERVDEMVRLSRKSDELLTHNIIWGRVKHRFRVGTYTEIPDTQFEVAMAFLQEMLERALDGKTPQQGDLFGK